MLQLAHIKKKRGGKMGEGLHILEKINNDLQLQELWESGIVEDR